MNGRHTARSLDGRSPSRAILKFLLVLLVMVLFVAACGGALVAGAYLFVRVVSG